MLPFLHRISSRKLTAQVSDPLVPSTSLYDIPTHSATKKKPWNPKIPWQFRKIIEKILGVVISRVSWSNIALTAFKPNSQLFQFNSGFALLSKYRNTSSGCTSKRQKICVSMSPSPISP